MTEKKHTPEPWRIESATKKDNWRIIGDNNQVVSTFSGSMDMANARRIVACVNACAGIGTDHLELALAGGVTVLQELDRVKQQRDQLRAALEAIADPHQVLWHGDPSDLREYARAALAETEGN